MLVPPPFLKKEEGWNNLFWQILKNRENAGHNGWSGNVFEGGRVCLSGLHTPSKFLLLSRGSKDAVAALAKYSHLKGWKLDGVCGPQSEVDHYLACRKEMGLKILNLSQRMFKLFQTSLQEDDHNLEEYKLVPVSKIDWPKARVWAQQFALEADPPMDVAAITQLAKQMYLAQNLFVLTNPENYPCAMAGFGRMTERYKVINLVYVPRELRGLGIGQKLITSMTLLAQESGYEQCLLFSEWMDSRNLYDNMGCTTLGKFVEYDLV